MNDNYRRLLAQHKNIERKCVTEKALCRLTYKELISAPNRFKPCVLTKSQGMGTTQLLTKEDVTTALLLQTQSLKLAGLSSDILNLEQRKNFQGIVLVVADLIRSKKLPNSNFIANLARINNLPLEVIWWYHTARVMDFTVYVGLNVHNIMKLERVTNGLEKLLAKPNVDGFEAAVAVDLLISLVEIVHGPKLPITLQDAHRVCCILLSSVLRRRIQALHTATDAIAPWWLVQILRKESSPLILPIMKKGFTGKMLRMLLTEPPLISVHKALTTQHDWSFSLAPPILTSALSLIIQALGGPKTCVDALNAVIQSGEEVNWKALLITVSAVIHSDPSGPALIEGIVDESLNEGAINSDPSRLLLAFLFVRQASSEGPNAGCLSYAAWFKKRFGQKDSPVSTSAANSHLLLEFLIQLVPHETIDALRTHLDQPPMVHSTCRELLDDYTTLANTRLRDLQGGASTFDISHDGLFPRQEDNSPTAQEDIAKYDIQQAIDYFAKTDKIHPAILQGFIFKKKYVETYFLPQLLKTKYVGANCPHVLLVDKLLAAKKISQDQYEEFHVWNME